MRSACVTVRHQVSRGRAFAQFAGELVANHLRNQHGNGLAQHGGLGLNAAHAPAQHAKAIDHRGVRIGADHRVWISHLLAIDLSGKHHARQVLEIHLVADAHSRRHSREVAEGRLAPLQKCVALAVALELKQRIRAISTGGAVLVHLHGVVDDQFGGHQRIDALRIAAQ